MRELFIKGTKVLVDDMDYEPLSKMPWYISNGRPVTVDGLTMARAVMSADKDQVVFYKDRDVLNNQRSNLEVVSKMEAAKRIGSLGGKKGTTGGFFANRELARIAGRKGGTISRRRKKLTDNVNDVMESGILG